MKKMFFVVAIFLMMGGSKAQSVAEPQKLLFYHIFGPFYHI